MAIDLIIAPEVERDIADAYGWYEQQRKGLGEEFLNCIDACVQTICRYPQMNAAVHENFRRGLVRRFPYAVYYEFEANTITIYAVFHAARDPQKWRRRLR